MATAETVDLGPPHAPKDESINAFKEVEHELKQTLIRDRHTYFKHEPEYFEAVQGISDHDFVSFTSHNFEEVRVAVSAYGIHLFGKVRIPALPESGPSYIQFRAFSPGDSSKATFHSIHTEEKTLPSGDKKYRAIFTKNDPLEWFDS